MTSNPLAISTTATLAGIDLVNKANGAFSTLATLNSGSTAPTTTTSGLTSMAGVLWHDTGTNALWLRNQADSAWISLGMVDEANTRFSSSLKYDTSLRQKTDGTWQVQETVTMVAIPQSISQATHFSNFVATAAVSFSLAQTTASGMFNGCCFAVLAQGGAVTLQPGSGDKIQGGVVNGSYIIPQGSSALVVTDGAGNWWVYFQSTAASNSVAVPMRQTALSGSVDGNGLANFLSISSNLVKLSATAVNLVLAYAAGFSSTGPVDYIGLATADTTPWGTQPSPLTILTLTASGTTATCTTTAAHGLISGAQITVTGAVATAYNVTNAAVTVIDATHFSYTTGTAPGGNATTVGAYTVTSWPSLPLAQTISSLSASGSTTATCNTGAAHNLTTGAQVVISGASNTVFNGTFAITVTGSTAFTYTLPSSQTATPTGASYVVQAFLYSDRNNGGTPVYGFSTIPPVYATTAPTSPATNQHWFDLTVFTMKVWSGSAWTVMQRVFLGEVTTNATTVASLTTYGLLGRYDSGLFAYGGPSSNTSLNHNLGLAPRRERLTAVNQIAEQIYVPGDEIDIPTGALYSVNAGIQCYYGAQARTNVVVRAAYTTPFALFNATNASYGATTANWKLRLILERGW